MDKEVVVTEKDLPHEVLEEIKNGRKIVAIKLLREATGLGLANAKVLVDRAAAKHNPVNPMPLMVEEQSNATRLLMMLLVVTAIFAFYHFFLDA